jgi:hypothetical protein
MSEIDGLGEVSDSFSETSHEGCFERLKNAIVGVGIGVLMFFGSFVVLWWNEGNSVRTMAAIAEGREAVREVEASRVDSANQGKLIHLSDMATSESTLEDRTFGVRVEKSLLLERTVEMYQWREEKETKSRKNLGGGKTKTTTYNYEKVWSDHVINSNNFKHKDGHINPSSMAYQSQELVGAAKIGAFDLPETLVREVNARENLPQSGQPRAGPAGLETRDGYLYLASGQVSGSGGAGIGDLRISFKVLKPLVVSLIAKQTGQSLEPWRTSVGQDLYRIFDGKLNAPAIFDRLEQENSIMTWVLRAVGAALMFFGLLLILNPLSVMADVVPFVGDLVGMGLALASGLVTLVLASTTIALAWLFYRPLFAIPLLLLAGFGLSMLLKARKPKPLEAAS